MAKTVLELTPEELRRYKPAGKLEVPSDTGRWERAWQVARSAAKLLRQRFGATRVLLFGSLVDFKRFTPWSDIDLAAWGIPAGEFYRAVAMVTGLSPEFELDLVEPETCRPGLRRRIEQEGIEL
ncbi:MAG: nucleotidyltransferase domain-containing protein [Deltaproteobacteria bacterium]|nr:nucleotidyltransferase domain-containing protein [Deltaproteobacteria bacterium]MBW2034728.1 nucleotidyltransferase domain-containing protein [Deltaproteobacteria bacterium]MBW2170235.1 nucleotidyltransferase domain-containing protein [Deltaproteobacteria bacterium]